MARYKKFKFQDCPETTYLLTKVMLMEDMQYARTEAPALLLMRENTSAIFGGTVASDLNGKP
jgi:hypothetical protein